MTKKYFTLLLTCAALAFTGCKTDSEEDLNSGKTPDNLKPTHEVVLNEICGKDNPDNDWVEFFNPSDKDVDLSGAKLIKTDEDGMDEQVYVFPGGAILKSKNYQVITKNEDFPEVGISNSKEVGLRLVSADNKTLYDKFDRDSDVGKDKSHEEGGSYARIPDGTGAWKVVAKYTKGTANSDEQPASYTQLVINEVNGLSNPDNDWIELYNKGTETIDLSGMKIEKTDEDGKKDDSPYVFPKGTKIEGKGYYVITTLQNGLTFKISNKKQITLTLFAADGTQIDQFDRDKNVGKDKTHEKGGSYARIPDGTGSWTVTSKSTENAANEQPVESLKKVVFNEICGLQDPDDDWIELYNPNTQAMDLSVMKIVKTDEKGESKDIYSFPKGTKIEGKGYLVIPTLPEGKGLLAGISNKKEVILILVSKDGKTVWDKFDRDVNIGKDKKHDLGESYARTTDGTGKWVITKATRGKANQ